MGGRDPSSEMRSLSPTGHSDLGDTNLPRVRRRSPSSDGGELRKRRRGSSPSDPFEPAVPRRNSYGGGGNTGVGMYSRGGVSGGYGNGYGSTPPPPPSAAPAYARGMASPAGHSVNKSRRLYVGNIPYTVGLSEIALTQFFSALYVAGFRANRDGEPLPVQSVWLHSDGKFGFMELRGDQEAVNMMLLNGVVLHGRPLRINRPSDYRPEVHNPAAARLVPESINVAAIVKLCDELGDIVAPPAQLPTPSTMPGPRNQESPAAEPSAQHTGVNGVGNGTSYGPSTAPPAPSPPTSLRSQPATTSAPKRDPAVAPNGHTKEESKSECEGSVESKSDHGDGDVAVSGPTDSRGGVGGVGSGGGGGRETVVKTEGEEGGNVISLVNLVTHEDLDCKDADYFELVDDVRSECGQYGDVKCVEVPRTGAWKGTAFIEYAKNEHAQLAVDALRVRVFDGRLIKAQVMKGFKTAAAAAQSRPSRS